MGARIVTLADFSNRTTFAPSPNLAKQLISEVATAALKELTVSLALATATVFFIAGTGAIAILFTGAIVSVLFNIAVRGLPRYYAYKLYQLENSRSKDQALIKEYREKKADAEKVEKFFCPFTFISTNYVAGAGTLVHEAGHAAAAAMVYQNPRVTVSVTPFGGGSTEYNTTLNAFGKTLGGQGSRMFVSAAGAGIWSVINIGLMLASYRLKKSHEELSRYLLMTVIISVAQHAIYALSALMESLANTSHDFVSLWLGGIHPIVSAITIIAIPLLVKGAIILYEKYKNKN